MPRTAAASTTRDGARNKATPNGNTTSVPTAVPDLPILNAVFTMNELRNEHANDRVPPPISFSLATFTLAVAVNLSAADLHVDCDSRVCE
jgi:hypothetical protein